MNGVIGMTGLMRETDLTKEQENYARAADASGRTLLSIIDEILDTTKIEAGRLEIKPSPSEIASIAESVTELLAPAGHLSQANYSRERESLADARALQILNCRYGHAGGAAGLFEALADYDAADRELPALLATHPADAARIARLQEAARGWDASVQPLVALPPL